MTTTRTSGRARASSSYGKAAKSNRFDAALTLGRKLTQELGLDNSVDTLGRWMTHYVAGLICELDHAPDCDRPAKERECYNSILELWQHRHETGSRIGHLSDRKAILSTLAKLSGPHGPFYLSTEDAAGAAIPTGGTPWLRLAIDIDRLAKVLIRHCLAESAVPDANQLANWASLAAAAGAEPDFDTSVFQLIVQEMGQSEEDAQRARLTDRRERLRRFIALATEGEVLLTRQIDGAPRNAGKTRKRNLSPASQRTRLRR